MLAGRRPEPGKNALSQFRLRYGDREFVLSAGDFVIGRSPDCGLALDDVLVSRQHAVIRCGEGELSIEDLGSANGVLVNGTRITRATELWDRDRIQIGGHRMEVMDLDARRARAAAPTIPGKVEPIESLRPAPGPGPGAEHPRLSSLSAREIEVLTLIARGHTNKEIGAQLHVSVKTVETHRARVAQKLSLRSRADIEQLALETGLLSR
jgi:DNA-binding CsgD family transcriptional regulator